jgi:hypothetical protein
MKYDSKQLELNLNALNNNKEITTQQYHKICGAIEMVEAMLKAAKETEQKEAEEAEKENAIENSNDASMDSSKKQKAA